MRFTLIDIEARQNAKCFYCNTNKSVKYLVELFDNPNIEDINKRYCCNKCITMLFDKECIERERNQKIMLHFI